MENKKQAVAPIYPDHPLRGLVSMKSEKRKTILQAAGFFLLTIVLIIGLNAVFKPKWSADFKSGSNIRGFYQMPKDTIDVLILGSSNVICGVNANEMFAESGVSGWSCGTEAQPLYGSLAWLKEALRYQKPVAVVLDVGDLFEGFDEISYRKTFDYMRLSPLKVRLLKKYKENHPEINFFSYILPLVQYHSRLSDLSREDFFYKDVSLKGFYIRTEKRGSSIPGLDGETAAEREIPKENLESLMQIIEICQDNSMELVLISCPSARVTALEHNTVQRVAEEYGLAFLDFNDVSKWPDIDYSKDMADFQHFNVYGAEKATLHILNTLKAQRVLPDRSDSDLQRRLSEEYRMELERAFEAADEADRAEK